MSWAVDRLNTSFSSTFHHIPIRAQIQSQTFSWTTSNPKNVPVNAILCICSNPSMPTNSWILAVPVLIPWAKEDKEEKKSKRRCAPWLELERASTCSCWAYSALPIDGNDSCSFLVQTTHIYCLEGTSVAFRGRGWLQNLNMFSSLLESYTIIYNNNNIYIYYDMCTYQISSRQESVWLAQCAGRGTRGGRGPCLAHFFLKIENDSSLEGARWGSWDFAGVSANGAAHSFWQNMRRAYTLLFAPCPWLTKELNAKQFRKANKKARPFHLWYLLEWGDTMKLVWRYLKRTCVLCCTICCCI